MKNLIYIILAVLVIGNMSCSNKDTKDPIYTPADTRLKDIDGNVYDTIKVGSQVWMKSNLKTTRYNDGTSIPTGITAWLSTSTGAYAVYNNENTNDVTFGKLYNWYAINTGKLAPKGWHVATEAEWNTLINNLGGHYTACSVMLSAESANIFTVRLGGERYHDGNFFYRGTQACFWTSTESTAPNGRYLTLCNCGINIANCFASKQEGFSVRCIRN